MADSSQSQPEKITDTFTAKQTLNFLASRLREEHFILRGQTIKRLKLQFDEEETKKRIANLHERINRELSMSPDLFKKK